MSKITTFLWFDTNAEEAVNFYTSIFKNSKITGKSMSDGKVFIVNFELDGQQFMALEFKFSESISLYVSCDSQQEIDYYWDKLSADPKSEQCGWLKDKFGLSWQIVPSELGKLKNSNPVKSKRVMDALLKMKKLDLAKLKRAYNS